jgi:hypothetical protein
VLVTGASPCAETFLYRRFRPTGSVNSRVAFWREKTARWSAPAPLICSAFCKVEEAEDGVVLLRGDLLAWPFPDLVG